MVRFIGIDPGFGGALACVDFSRLEKLISAVQVFDMPTYYLANSRRSIDINSLKALLVSMKPVDHVIIEQVASRPGDGPVGAFSFGCGYGILLGLCAGLNIPHTTVLPAVWKKELSCSADKDEARARASQLLPLYSTSWLLKKHDGRAEAALIALFGIRRLT